MFRLLMSDDLKRFVDDLHAESIRMYKLTDSELANELLQLARVARDDSPELKHDRGVYDTEFVWHALPELARRLGGISDDNLSIHERNAEARRMSDLELRELVGYCISFISVSSHWRKPGWSILLKDPANGNPVIYALDRLSPGDINHPDKIVTRMAEIAKYRKVEYNGVWTPNVLASDDRVNTESQRLKMR